MNSDLWVYETIDGYIGIVNESFLPVDCYKIYGPFSTWQQAENEQIYLMGLDGIND